MAPGAHTRLFESAPDTQSDPQSPLLECLGDTFRDQGARMLYVRKTYYLPCFNHIRRVRAPCFRHPASLRDAAVTQFGIFPTFPAARGATRCPKGAKQVPRPPKATPKAPQNRSKINAGTHLGAQAAQEVQKVPTRAEMCPKSMQKLFFLNARL